MGLMGCWRLWLYYKLHTLRHLGSTLFNLWSHWSSGQFTLQGVTKHEQHLMHTHREKFLKGKIKNEAMSTISKNKPQFAHTQTDLQKESLWNMLELFQKSIWKISLRRCTEREHLLKWAKTTYTVNESDCIYLCSFVVRIICNSLNRV